MGVKLFNHNLSIIYKSAPKCPTVEIFWRKTRFSTLRSLEIVHLRGPLDFFNALFDFHSGGPWLHFIRRKFAGQESLQQRFATTRNSPNFDHFLRLRIF